MIAGLNPSLCPCTVRHCCIVALDCTGDVAGGDDGAGVLRYVTGDTTTTRSLVCNSMGTAINTDHVTTATNERKRKSAHGVPNTGRQ